MRSSRIFGSPPRAAVLLALLLAASAASAQELRVLDEAAAKHARDAVLSYVWNEPALPRGTLEPAPPPPRRR